MLWVICFIFKCFCVSQDKVSSFWCHHYIAASEIQYVSIQKTYIKVHTIVWPYLSFTRVSIFQTKGNYLTHNISTCQILLVILCDIMLGLSPTIISRNIVLLFLRHKSWYSVLRLGRCSLFPSRVGLRTYQRPCN